MGDRYPCPKCGSELTRQSTRIFDCLACELRYTVRRSREVTTATLAEAAAAPRDAPPAVQGKASASVTAAYTSRPDATW